MAMVRGYVLPSMQISHVCLKTAKMTCDKCEKQVSKHASTATRNTDKDLQFCRDFLRKKTSMDR